MTSNTAECVVIISKEFSQAQYGNKASLAVQWRAVDSVVNEAALFGSPL